jgi:hypothetical protein
MLLNRKVLHDHDDLKVLVGLKHEERLMRHGNCASLVVFDAK